MGIRTGGGAASENGAAGARVERRARVRRPGARIKLEDRWCRQGRETWQRKWAKAESRR